MTTVTIDGQQPEAIIDVTESVHRGRELGQAQVVVADTQTNRTLAAPGVSLVIQRDGARSLSGYVTGEPSDSNGTLTIRGMVSAGELKHLQADRVVYNERSSEVVKSLVTDETETLERPLIHTADDASSWESQAPVAHLYTGPNAGLYRWGTDMVFLGARSGFAKPFVATYTGVTSDHIRDGIDRLETRFIAANRDDILDVEIELVTPDGTTYLWTPELRDSFYTYDLPAEEASTDGDVSDTGVLQYRFVPEGELISDTGIFIDHAATVPFKTTSRDAGIGIGSVDQTDRRITRRITERVGVAIDDIAMEDGAEWWVDTDDDFNFSTGGGPGTTASIDGSTPIAGVTVDRDYEDVRNIVTIQYADDQAVTVKDPESIGFYGPVPREEPLETDLENETEAIDRGRGYLREHAWNDALATFHVADMGYADVPPGGRIQVDWPDENLVGSYRVETVAVESTQPGVVDVTIAASSD